ncbi:MAG TPA: phosphotransferase family protein [Acidimicrobiales bacterium]
MTEQQQAEPEGPAVATDADAATGTAAAAATPDEITVSTRDDEEVRQRLSAWLAGRLGAGTAVTALERPSANGMSSDTVLVDAAWVGDGGAEQAGSFVVRIEPADDAFPVFPVYDLAAQARIMRMVGERSSVPVPTVRWFEPSRQALGAPFIVMDRIDGRVPPDVMPYTMGSWVTEATDAERAALQDAAVGVLAGVHGVPTAAGELEFLDAGRRADAGATGGSALRRHVDVERRYYQWVCGDDDTPLLARAFAWLEDNWPAAADAADPVLCWGDARIGNMLFDGFTPVGVLDWEMASPGPRELDIGWMIFLHRFFQDLTEELGLPGLPDMFRPDAVAETYARASGHEPRDLDWFVTYAAVRHGVIMTRVMGRQVHFGEHAPPEDPEEFILHRAALAKLLDGAYWER